MPGTLSPAAAGAAATTPLGHLDLQQDGRFPGTTASTRILSPTLPVLPIPQTAPRALPLREPLLGVSCWVQPTAPRWSQCDMQLPVHTGPQESTPTSTVDRGSLARAGRRGSGRGRQNGLSGQQRRHGPHQHSPAASLKTSGRGQPPACTATVVGAWPTPSALRPRSGQTTHPGSTLPQQSLIPDSSEYSAFSGQVSSLTSYIYIWSHHAACGILVP